MSDRKSSAAVKRKELIARLSPVARQAFQAAAQTAKMRGNPYVELVHLVEQMMLSDRCDFAILLDASGVDRAVLARDVTAATDKLPHGASAVEEFSDHLFDAIREGWQFAELEFREETIRSGHILLGALQRPALEALLFKISLEFDKVASPALLPDWDDILLQSTERTLPPGEIRTQDGAQAPTALDRYATNLTARATAGKIDPVIGRDPEIRQMIDILMRRRQNNPILTGEAGVGKTAAVEGFALRLARGDVPPTLKPVQLWMLDIGLMQAGASIKGEFEKRLKAVIDEVQSSDVPIILFIDEAHTLIGAGGAAGTGDAANLLKPALARGELRTIAATTWAEYKEHIEKDPALTRRFQPVVIDEPSEESAVRILRAVAGVLEQHHKVEILDEAISAAVHMSHRYIPARQLPDKAISLLDTAAARVAVSQHATPAEVEDLERREAALLIEDGIVAREGAVGLDVADRAERVAAELAEVGALRDAADARWQEEQPLVEEFLSLRADLRRNGAPGDEGETLPLTDQEREAALAHMATLRARLSELQGDAPLILPTVDAVAVATVVQDWTGIPAGRMMASETEKVLSLAALLSERVVGQDHAMEMIANRIQTSQAGLEAPEKPIGVFLLCGTSGVGKTETALALAEELYGGEQNLISINMSEFQEAHTVATLKGAPPGYVGYGKGGVLTEAVRRRPYSVILLDEVEKAHPDVHEIFFQVFDKGMMDDSEGRRIDFSNTLILLTSNAGSDEIMTATKGGAERVDIPALTKTLRSPLLKIFPAALLGRVVTIPYYPLSDDMIEAIAGHQLGKIAKRLMAGHGAELEIGAGVLPLIKARCTEVESGGRQIDAILTNTLLPELSRQVMSRSLEGLPVARVIVDADDSGFTYQFEP